MTNSKNRQHDHGYWKWIVSLRACLIMWIPIVLISFCHYFTMSKYVWLHDVYRRLYYIPIILGAFSYGIKGGISASIITSLVYAPHAFTLYFVNDPADGIEKFLEIALYNIIGLITGHLAKKERSARIHQEAISNKLANTIVEKKLLQDQLIRAGKLKALGELTAGIAHEIKNPLASIQGAAEAIADEIPESSPRRKLVDIQNKELKRLSNTLDRFLAFAKPNKFLVSEVDLCDLIQQVVRLVGPQAAKKSVEVVSQCSRGLIAVQGDRDQLTQVLINLVINAFDAMTDGGRVHLSVKTDTVGAKAFSVIEVTDNGPGIPQEEQEKIFDPFHSTKEGGTGLGLSISSNIIDAHAGFIKVAKGKDGKGTCFSVFLPLESP